MTRYLWTLALSLFALPGFAAALTPNSGLWWEEPVTGRFYSVEIAPSGSAYVVISEFDAAGKPVWRALRGRLEVSDAAAQAAGAPLATLRAPLLEIDGACPSCPPVAPNVRPSALGEASIVFTTHAQAEFRQGATRRPLRYFSPADQPQDFPSVRLPGDYVVAVGAGGQMHTGTARLRPASNPACARYEGNTPPAGATRLSGGCPTGPCEGNPTGVLLGSLELAVGPGEHPAIVAYRRQVSPEAIRPLIFVSGFPTGYFRCPAGYSRQPNPIVPSGPSSVSEDVCILDGAPAVCVESHRIAEHAGTLRGLPVRGGEASFALFPAP